MSAMPASSPPPGVAVPATLLNRFLARLVDHVLLGFVQALVFGVMSVVVLTGGDGWRGRWLTFYLVVSLLWVAISLAYFGLLESRRGQTVGKMLFKLRTFGPDGESNPTLEEALRRSSYVGLTVISVVPLLGPVVATLAEIAAVVVIAITLSNDVPDHQGVHDRLAGGTLVRQLD